MKRFNTAIFGLAALLAVTLLAGCNGGGGGGDGSSGTLDASLIDGIWVGTIHNNSTGLNYDALAFAYNGEIRTIDLQSSEVCVGSPSLSTSSDFTALLTCYEIGGSILGTVTMTGMYGAKDYVSATYATSTGVTGSVVLDYSTFYDRTSSLNKVAGIWSYTDGVDTTTVTVQNDGSVLGSDTGGCVMSGNITLLDTNVNMYRMAVTVTSCPNTANNGNFSGLLTLTDHSGGTDNGMLFAINSANTVVWGGLIKQ